MATQNNQFRKDVLKAKAKYRKRRKLLILSVMSMVLAVTLIQTYMYIREKKQISNQLTEQNNTIEKLDKENKVNELVIDKLKDPYFITDLVRQEYGLSYQGEIIFNLPLQESFLQTTIKSIMDGDLQKVEDNHGRIDDSKIPELSKKDTKKKGASEKDNKNNTTDNEDEKNTSEQNTTRQTTNPNTTNQRGNRG
ncbi:FtsB family cell division protein [Gemella morbillorum]|uniref:FtsB family cell division protein n=1 Tax=Gemella morbillorum TaxID=29391 RepID=UPI001CAC9BCA|nr:septum formation initiator family protein [Gemella morbillorum]MBF1213041.1 septum formation initiator family protein [Gemella morbillorum]